MAGTGGAGGSGGAITGTGGSSDSGTGGDPDSGTDGNSDIAGSGLMCVGGTSRCGDKCTELQSDVANCGACNSPCPVGASCSGGKCKPAVSCRDILESGKSQGSGIYTIDPTAGDAADAFNIYCDMVTDGGGWAIVWKNQGGAKGGTKSNAQLFAEPGVDIVMPYTLALGSERHEKAWAAYFDSPNREWIKIATLWGADDKVENDEHLRVVMGPTSMMDIFANPSVPCVKASAPIKVYVNDNKPAGQTDWIFHYTASSFGLANNGNETVDLCGETGAANVINNGSSLFRIDGGNGLNAIRHLFSYVHDGAGQDTSRCLHACWDATNFGGQYEAFMWGVR
jgi:hypothetical protein